MKVPIELLKDSCNRCGSTGKKFIDSRGFQVNPDHTWLDKNKAKETKEICPYCIGSGQEPTDFGIEILEFVKKYLNVKT